MAAFRQGAVIRDVIGKDPQSTQLRHSSARTWTTALGHNRKPAIADGGFRLAPKLPFDMAPLYGNDSPLADLSKSPSRRHTRGKPGLFRWYRTRSYPQL